MWDGPGPGQGPRGGLHFRGDHREEMFRGRDRPMPDFRGRDGMNMGPMGHMGPRHLDMPPMDMRRMDGPPMRGHDMDPREMGGREPQRDFLRRGEEPDFPFRRQVEISFREKVVNTSSFGGPGRSCDMGGRNMPLREPSGRFMDMDRERDGFQFDKPPFHNDGRRGFPMDRMERNDGFRERRDRSPMGMHGNDGYDMDMPPHERRMVDMDRRGGPPFNPRGGFDSDRDFRNRPGPLSDFRGRGRSPLRFGNDSLPPTDKGRPDLPPDVSGPQRPKDLAPEDPGDFQQSGDSPLTDYRSGEEMTLAEEWKNRNKDKNPYGNFSKGFGGINEPNFSVGFGRDGNDPLHFPQRDRMSLDYPGKDFSFPRGGRFPVVNLPSSGSKAPPDRLQPHKEPLSQENESKRWLEDRDPKHNQPQQNQEKNQPTHEMQGLKDMSLNQGPARTKMDGEHEFQSSSSVQTRDQDYRDIDYRTASGAFDFKHEEFQTAEKFLKESKPIAPSRFNESTSQDQDYRGAAVEDKVSNTISIIGIPKTATMEQILGAFATPEGVPIEGMKIKNVVPGYSYDTAIVEFLNLEDAVHFMESNKGSLKVGTRTASMKFVRPEECEKGVQESNHNIPQQNEPQLSRPSEAPEELKTIVGSKPQEQSPANPWQRSSDLTPEAWQRQVDQQLQQQEAEQRAEPWSGRHPPYHHSQQSDSVFKDSKTMIIKNVKPTTTVETILKALDPFAYLDERNVRLVKAKTPGGKCFCFVDMDSHEQVKRLVELLTKPRPLYIDGVRVYAEVAKPLKNQVVINRREFDSSPAGNSSILGNPPQPNMIWPQQPQQFMQPPQYMPPIHPPVGAPPEMQGGMMPGTANPPLPLNHSINQGVGFGEPPPVNPLYQAAPAHVPSESAGMAVVPEASQPYVYAAETPDVSNYLYDATSGFYYDPETTLYYDPNSRYFYNAETQEYLYWDAVSKTYIPVPGGHSAESQPVTMTAEDQAILSNPAADAPLEMKKPPTLSHTPAAPPLPVTCVAPELVPNAAAAQDKKEEDDSAKKDKDNKEEKPKSRAAVKIMKDMERWAKIQNRQKESVRAPSPLLKGDDDKRQSKSADAGFAIFERKISGSDDLFKKPFAPTKKDEKSKRSMGSLGMLASDYGAGSDDEVEEDKEEAKVAKNTGQPEEKEDKLTDWKKMACLLCRRQFPNKDALIRHQQLSDLHKQNMEIHLKIKRSKKELEALENQEKELNARVVPRSPEQKKRKQQQNQDDWAGSSRESNKVSERPGLGAEPATKKKKKPVVWDHASYQQAVRKAMFARYKELE